MYNRFKFILFFITIFTITNLYAQQKSPNIIYILADDLGYGDISAFNEQSKIKTKHIDALATNGMRFTDAHTNSSVCSPTRYGILTGRYAWRTHLQSGVLWSYDKPLIDNKRATVASILKQKGYNTACIGKWHLGLGWQKDGSGKVDFAKPLTEGPNTIGFDYFYGITASLDIPPYFYIKNDKITATKIDSIPGTKGKAFWREGPIGDDFKHEEVLPHLTQKAVEYVQEQAKKTQPFFLYFPLPSPHTPILPSKEYLGKSGTNEYGDFVLMTDDMVGRVLDAVKNAGIEDNTIIIFTSDNGVSPAADLQELQAAGHQPSYVFRGAKADIYEGGHRVPFVVKWPKKVKAGTTSSATICLTDFMATAAQLTNYSLKDNEGEDSFSMLPLLLQNGEFKRTSIVHHSIDGNFAIREGKWKLAFAHGSGGWSEPTEKNAKEMNMPPVQLFDMEKDISEKNSITSGAPAFTVLQKLTKDLENIINNGRSTPGKKQANDVAVKLNKYFSGK